MSFSSEQNIDEADNLAEQLREQAIDWMVTLQSGEVTAQEQQRFLAWLTLSTQHQAVWQSITDSITQPTKALQDLSHTQQPLVEQVLLRNNTAFSIKRRAFLRNSIVVVALVGVAHRYQPLSNLTADFSTGTGERATHTLADGSELILNARTQVNINVTRAHGLTDLNRILYLTQGELQLTSNQQTTPFIIQCRDGDISLESNEKANHCLVKQYEDQTFVLALTGKLALKNKQGSTRYLNAGEGVYFNEVSIEQTQNNLNHKTQWSQGLYLAKNESLHALTQALSDYYPGFIHVSAEAKKLQVYGGYPLDELDKTFTTLEQTLAIKVRRLGDVVTFITLA
ncbi:FecR domain-containing protein [Colwellia asteriadis]|uniref:FecR domain-containing protein n=1 Tax=Colwellia asteriadis TaxID=517723 RepID=A0ABP3WD04_9GAMM